MHLKKKLELKNLKVKSFITSMGEEQKVRGGQPDVQAQPVETHNLTVCTFISELYSACTCPPSWHTQCSIGQLNCHVTIAP